MEPTKAGDMLYCDKCSVELEVKKGCDSNPCEVSCCGEPMKVKGSENKGGCCCGDKPCS